MNAPCRPYPSLTAGLVGMALVELFLPPFRRLSGVEGDVYGMSLLYFAGLVGVSVLFLLPVAFRRTPDGGGRKRSGLSYRLAVGVQMAVGILFIFCMSVLMKQLHYLRHTDFGWTRAERAVLSDWDLKQSYEPVADYLSAQPNVCYVARHCHGYFPASVLLNTVIEDWEGRQSDEVLSENLTFGIDSTLMDFHGLELLEGRLPLGGRDEVVVNEAAARRLGWGEKAVGRWLKSKYGSSYTVVGLLRDFQASAPTVPVRPALFLPMEGLNMRRFGNGQILIRYREGTWEELKRKTEEYFATHYPDERYDLYNLEDFYTGQYLQSELLLLKLLGFASVACVLISAFGIYSMVTLSCERRRKEIAIRKVNGARVGDILRMFVREYLVLLLLASVPAFLAGYVLMRRWMERYVEQCAIPWWMYLAIFAGVASVVALCIGSRVWKAARQNPAEVVKSE